MRQHYIATIKRHASPVSLLRRPVNTAYKTGFCKTRFGYIYVTNRTIKSWFYMSVSGHTVMVKSIRTLSFLIISLSVASLETHGTVKNLPKIGRPRKPPARIDAHIVRVGEKSETPSAVDIAKQLATANIVVLSIDTVNMRLNESG